MANPDEQSGQEEKKLAAAAASQSTTNEQQQTSPEGPQDHGIQVAERSESDSDELEGIRSDDDDVGFDVSSKRPKLSATKSYATDASAATGADTFEPEPVKPKWHHKFNPLRWGGVPPVPDERFISREYKAGFFSKLTFQWMAPLMAVSNRSLPLIHKNAVTILPMC